LYCTRSPSTIAIFTYGLAIRPWGLGWIRTSDELHRGNTMTGSAGNATSASVPALKAVPLSSEASTSTDEKSTSEIPAMGVADAAAASTCIDLDDVMLAYQIELTLTELAQTVRGDPSGKDLPTVVDEALDSLSSNSAVAYLSLSPTPDQTEHPGSFKAGRTGLLHRWFGGGSSSKHPKPAEILLSHDEELLLTERIKHQVTRFLKVPDKYIAWTSILLKSQAFHQTYSHTSNGTTARPIIELPRTEYKKPYIPSIIKHDSFPEVNLHPISISHQFPFVGLARLVVTEFSHQPQHRPLVGLDIVTFDNYNPRLYDSADAFLEVFKMSFTEWEWTCIHANESSMLLEFYLRWATKEAYTKALGVGMGLSFDSFESHLLGVTDSTGIYPWLLEQSEGQGNRASSIIGDNHYQQPFHVRGTVVINPVGDAMKSEDCTFYFLPLWDPETGTSPTSTRMMGCACICLVLPTSAKPRDAIFHLKTSWQSRDDLVAWHKNV
jgi:4'-phosphopantetheinyl transferase superfamily